MIPGVGVAGGVGGVEGVAGGRAGFMFAMPDPRMAGWRDDGWAMAGLLALGRAMMSLWSGDETGRVAGCTLLGARPTDCRKNLSLEMRK